MTQLIPGHATSSATKHYAETFGKECAPGHYSDFLNLHLQLSSLGIGTFPGAASDAGDAAYAEIIERTLTNGINVVDTAAHYRYCRSPSAVGEGLRRALARGVMREQVYLISKGGFLGFREGPPADFEVWFEREIVAKKLGTRADLSKAHLISPQYIQFQLEFSRHAMGVETLDAFLIDQPEVHIPKIGKDQLNRKLEQVFIVLERAVNEGKLRAYGISTYEGFRVETDHPLFQSVTSMQGHAEKAAQLVQQRNDAKHHFKVIQLPFNQVMLEGFTRFSHATGQGNIGSTIQAAFQLKVYVMASHTMLKGHLAQQSTEIVQQSMASLKNHAQRALQFNRSTPGLGTSLVGVSSPTHLDDVLAVARIPPLEKAEYLKMYQKAE